MFQIFAASEQHYRDISGDLDRQTRDVVTRARSEIELAQAQSVQAIAAAIASAADQIVRRRVQQRRALSTPKQTRRAAQVRQGGGYAI
jgi:hypothetical protein